MSKAQLTQPITLTQEQLEVLNGALLGDGCLYLHSKGKNAQFIYTSKSSQHVNFVFSYFKEYLSGEDIKENSYYDQRTNKTYTRTTAKTYTNETFTQLYNLWYVNKIKQIPKNLILTPLTCLIWYIGDGGISHGQRSENIKLSTHCFLKEDLEKIIIPQLKQFEATLAKADKENQYFIYIPHRKEKDFLNYIGECPFSDYLYKWQIAEYKNSLPKDDYRKYEKEFCEEYLKGENYYQIAKKKNIEPNVVKYYLIKNNIYKKPNLKLKFAIIQIDKNTNQFINIFPSIAEAGRQLKITPSGISAVLNNRRQSAGGYKWKKLSTFSEEEIEQIKLQFKEYFNEI